MGNYYKVSAKAVAEAFDGTQVRAEALETAYSDVISIAKGAATYPILAGSVTVDPSTTGVATDVDITKVDEYTPYEVVVGVTSAASASGDMSIDFFEEDPIVIPITYETLTGTVSVAPAATGVTADIAIVRADEYDPYVVDVDVTAGASASGDLTFTFYEEDPIVVPIVYETLTGTVSVAPADTGVTADITIVRVD